MKYVLLKTYKYIILWQLSPPKPWQTCMAGLIPQNFIDELLDRIDIVEVVDQRVKLKRTGKNYSACCPFHDEKTPSFTVSPDKQFYYCFGCGASGNSVGFLMEIGRLSFPEAVEQLAQDRKSVV